MRLDKFLKLTRIIKRRTVAREISDAGKVIVDKRVVKPAYTVKVGDVLELYLAQYILIIEVLSVDETLLRTNPDEGYKLLRRSLNAN